MRTGYKYLGITQLERDTGVNGPRVVDKVIEEVKGIIGSKLAVHQKIQLMNSSVVPAATYVLGNLYPQEQNRGTIKRCKELDTKIRVLLVKEGIKPYAASGGAP